jgi:hypothetical protein
VTRPRDENGRALPAAWRRLPDAASLEMAAVMAISADGRSCFLDHKRKLELARKAINHVVDGDAVPKSVGGGVVSEFWRDCVEAVRDARAGRGG